MDNDAKEQHEGSAGQQKSSHDVSNGGRRSAAPGESHQDRGPAAAEKKDSEVSDNIRCQ
jgi:hypothetical protein